jgi:hypothetical protein
MSRIQTRSNVPCMPTRRDANNSDARLPPRLVVFLYLQDVPTADHGPTIFLPVRITKILIILTTRKRFDLELDCPLCDSKMWRCGDL